MSAPETNPSAPAVIDALTLARSGAGCEYSFREQPFSRLSGLLVSDRPVLDVRLQFELQRGKPLIQGQLDGTVEVICQRCMQPMQYMLSEQFALLVCGIDGLSASNDDTEVEQEPIQWEEWVADATRIDVVEIVEEQVILALPLVPRHEDERVCAVVKTETTAAPSRPSESDEGIEVQADAAGMKRPFANLRELLTKSTDTR